MFEMHKGMVLGILAQFLQYGAALLLLPLIVIYLPAEEVGIWYVFMAVQGLAMLMDFGFQPTFSRSFALAFAGAQKLLQEGIAETGKAAPNLGMVTDILSAARFIYGAVALLVFILLATGGTLYISTLVEGASVDSPLLLIAWLVFLVAVSLNMYFMWVSPFLIGSNNVDKNYFYLIVNRITFCLMGGAGLMFGGGLVGLSASLLAGVIIARLAINFILKPIIADLPEKKTLYRSGIFKAIWLNACKLGLVSVGAFLIARANMFLVSAYFGLSVAASYGISIQVFTVISSVAQLSFQVNLPAMVSARVLNELGRLKKIFYRSTLFYFICFSCGSALVLLVGQILLDYIGSNAQLLDENLLYLLAVIIALEGNHSNSALVITTANRVPFVYPALVSGAAIISLSFALSSFGMGLIWIILTQGFVQLSYNNWKWPYMVYLELRNHKITGARRKII